jgi:hypothetical protein
MISPSTRQAHKHLSDRIVGKIIGSLSFRRYLRPFGIEWLLYHYRHREFSRITDAYRKSGDTTAMLAKLVTKNLIFTVTAGRSGTLFARQLFALLPNVTSEHEPEPAFHTYLRQIKIKPALATEFLLKYKLPYICNIRTPHYIEFSHIFCKGFLEPLLELGITPNIILLRRHPRLVALSYLQRYTVPARTFYGIEFLLSPRYERALPLPDWRGMTDYQLIFWYALEIERRQREYSRLIPARGGIVCDVTAIELNDLECFLELARTLGLPSPPASRDVARKHDAIARFSWNRNEGPLWHCKVDPDREEEEVWRAVSRTDPTLRGWVEERYQRRSTTITAPSLNGTRRPP